LRRRFLNEGLDSDFRRNDDMERAHQDLHIGLHRRQPGFSLLEIAVVLAVAGLVLAPAIALLFQMMTIPAERVDSTTLARSARQAVRWIGADARQAEAFTPLSAPDYGTFTWTDRASGVAPVTHAVRYFHSPADQALMREETIGGGPPEAFPIASRVASYGDVSIEETGRIVQASVTVGKESVGGPLAKTDSVLVLMRPVLPAGAPPTPPPLVLAWDDFESAGFDGGDGWLSGWSDSGDASVVTAGAPQEGSYHLRLRRANGYAERSLDLSGQANVRLQLWAKASGFSGGHTATLSVSTDGAVFTVVRTWTTADSDGVYRFEDVDLSGFSMTGGFFVALDAEMGNTNQQLYVDDLKVVRAW
jgi:prepilin-type N-terminal cleavage/methylation domain-containing protein